MIDPSLDLQAAIRDRLVNDPAVTALIAPASIRDGNLRPDTFPGIIFGPSQTVLENITFSRRHVRYFVDLHAWTKEAGTVAVKTLAAAVALALSTTPTHPGLIDFTVDQVRTMRDPGGEYGHAVISLSALVEAPE
ncbi:DUF3168 domain-containing protein [Jiella marina]|uniref:DUF3168 domain-containing protein n=1 Tax=Jiella sp. LLJ827 TaxID=2917712 RepID=UPI00210113EB|nr:DUF3168 domain-containing protein [Jiella sp. LLJ827]MCQ0989934.1 DUF3168 domain-containing protein [Jiella sp. LLJ827]